MKDIFRNEPKALKNAPNRVNSNISFKDHRSNTKTFSVKYEKNYELLKTWRNIQNRPKMNQKCSQGESKMYFFHFAAAGVNTRMFAKNCI